jgi:uncharacterized protein (TIGR00255 family)
MTGFGVARGKVGNAHFLVEARSVNHRFCEVNLRFPGRFASLEPEVTRLIRQSFSRGKFDLFLREEAIAKEREEVLLAKRAYQILKKIRREIGLQGVISFSDLLAFRQFFFAHANQDDIERIRRPLLALVGRALDGLSAMREREGRRLERWLDQRAKRLVRLLASIEKQALRRGKDYRRRLEEKMRGVGTVEEERLMREVALVAEKADVTEEIVRLRSHLKEFERGLRGKGPVGRKFDFLAQEMGREINTIGSKAQGVRLAHEVIEFKSELERVREQIQNIE